MTESLSFWPVECQEGEPNLFVCLTCLEEVFQSKVPVEGCPGCGAIGAFEPFNLEAIKDWGTEDLIRKAEQLPSSSVPVQNSNSDHPAE
jgi:hypothetical protein